MELVARAKSTAGRAVLAAIGIAIVAFVAGHFVWEQHTQIVKTKLLPPDTPPAEYLYLDTDRVLAYLGQIEGGLPASAKRTESQSSTSNASIKGGLVAEISGTAQQATSIEETVTPLATDRFFSLLINLRSGSELRSSKRLPWLHDIDAALGTDPRAMTSALGDLHEGDFIRLSDARLFLPPFASLVPRARYAASYENGAFSAALPLTAGGGPARLEREVNHYLSELGADPVLPFVVPSLDVGGKPSSTATFFVPARYSGLLDNPRLLSGNLTVVGKVIYIDRRPATDPVCGNAGPERGSGPPCTYFDRQSAASFAVALDRAPRAVRRLLGVGSRHIARTINRALRFRSPIVVVLPVAIYQ
jgi:hypothetical protein